jgi:hypothetical protein
LAVGSRSGFFVLLGNGNGTFKTAVEIDPDQVGGIATGDFNRDGQLDLVTVPYECGCSDAAVFLNACGSPGPRLSITREGIYISIFLPAPSFGYTLESARSLSSPTWTVIPPAADGLWAITTDMIEPEGYFRLRKP